MTNSADATYPCLHVRSQPTMNPWLKSRCCPGTASGKECRSSVQSA